jgi:hypothetical protein
MKGLKPSCNKSNTFPVLLGEFIIMQITVACNISVDDFTIIKSSTCA